MNEILTRMRNVRYVSTGYVQPVMEAFGIKFQLDSLSTTKWTGEFFTELYRPSDACHEFAHWLLCPNNRRNKAEFGLGPLPINVGSPIYAHIKMLIRPDAAWDEDMDALILGFSIFKYLGFNLNQYLDSMMYHHKFQYLFEDYPEAFYASVKRLQNKGLLDADLNFMGLGPEVSSE